MKPSADRCPGLVRAQLRAVERELERLAALRAERARLVAVLEREPA